jgi:hypothetical protein
LITLADKAGNSCPAFPGLKPQDREGGGYIMARIKRDERLIKQNEWSKWRWEFIRRNKEYQTVYQETKKRRKADEELYSEWDAKPEFPSAWEKEQAKNFGLLGDCLIDPAKSFEKIQKKIQKIKSEFPDIESITNESFKIKYSACEELHFYPATYWSNYSDIKWTKKGFSIDVDLTTVNSIGALHDDLKKLVGILCNDILKQAKGKKNHFAPGLKEFRLNEKKFPRILSTGDKIMQIKQELGDNFTFTRAFNILHPELDIDQDCSRDCPHHVDEDHECPTTCEHYTDENSIDDNCASSLYQAIRRDWFAYKDMISSGYRGISYP